MAIVDKGVKISVPSSIVPSDFVPPVVAEFNDFEYIRKYTLIVVKSVVENADRATTFGNIIDNVASGIVKQISDIIVADFIGTNNVEYYTDFKIISSNSVRSSASEFLTNEAFVYSCEVEVFIKTS